MPGNLVAAPREQELRRFPSHNMRPVFALNPSLLPTLRMLDAREAPSEAPDSRRDALLADGGVCRPNLCRGEARASTGARAFLGFWGVGCVRPVVSSWRYHAARPCSSSTKPWPRNGGLLLRGYSLRTLQGWYKWRSGRWRPEQGCWQPHAVLGSWSRSMSVTARRDLMRDCGRHLLALMARCEACHMLWLKPNMWHWDVHHW